MSDIFFPCTQFHFIIIANAKRFLHSQFHNKNVHHFRLLSPNEMLFIWFITLSVCALIYFHWYFAIEIIDLGNQNEKKTTFQCQRLISKTFFKELDFSKDEHTFKSLYRNFPKKKRPLPIPWTNAPLMCEGSTTLITIVTMQRKHRFKICWLQSAKGIETPQYRRKVRYFNQNSNIFLPMEQSDIRLNWLSLLYVQNIHYEQMELK